MARFDCEGAEGDSLDVSDCRSHNADVMAPRAEGHKVCQASYCMHSCIVTPRPSECSTAALKLDGFKKGVSEESLKHSSYSRDARDTPRPRCLS